MDKECENKEITALERLTDMEDITEKKAKIYSRLFMDADLAKDMENLALRHQKRKERLVELTCGKSAKSKNGQGRCEMNGEEEEK